jgi:membrane-associated phospholipid phosphatase
MKTKIFLSIGFFFCFTISVEAQSDSLLISTPIRKNIFKQSILPVSLIAGSILISHSRFEKSFQRDARNLVGNNFSTNADDYLKYVTVVELYAADAFRIKAKNHWFDQTKNLTIATVITTAITSILKNNINKTRPNGRSDRQSFPSGHTSFAFTNATVLYEEFEQTSPLLAYSGFVVAGTTGGLRIANNAHWLGDVMVSAGIGILVTKVIYYFDPIVKWNPFKKTKNVTLVPQFDDKYYGFYLCIRQ